MVESFTLGAIMKSTFEIPKDMRQFDIEDAELQIKELFRNFNVSTELIKRTDNKKELLDLILEEYIDRFDEIPGVDFVNLEQNKNGKWTVLEKLRSLILFASQAVVLKEKAELFSELENSNQKLAESTEKLNKNNKELRETNRQYLNMLGFVSHELRSPLISILGFSELLDEEVLGSLNEEQRKAVQVIIRSSNSLIDMIQNYLDLAKIEQGEIKLEKRLIDLFKDILLPLLEEFNEQLRKEEISVYVEGEKACQTAFCDFRLIKIVLNNLLTNAIKYGEQEGKICLQFLEKDNFVVTTVTNSGVGVKQKDINKIFHKFSQINREKDNGYRSSGLGLYNSKYIIEKHGGAIWAQSEFGQWFRVSFTLPKMEK